MRYDRNKICPFHCPKAIWPSDPIDVLMGSGGDGDRGPQPRKLRRGARDMCAHGPHSGAGPRRPCPSTNHLHFPRSHGVRHERLSPCHCSYTRVAALLLCTDWFHIMIARAQAPQDRHEHLISPLTTPLRYPMRLCKHGASRGVCWSTTSLPQVGLQLTIVVHRVIWSILAGGIMEHYFRACVSRASALLGREAFTRGPKQPL